jgi:hypothetical protein
LASAARQGLVCLGAGCLLVVAVAGGLASNLVPEAVAAMIGGIAAWCIAMAMLGLAARRDAVARPVSVFLREASLFFSVAAQPCAGLLAAAMRGWQVPSALQFALLFPTAFLVLAVIYAAARRCTLSRFLLGLAPIQQNKQGGS